MGWRRVLPSNLRWPWPLGVIDDGDKLPTEIDLAAQMGFYTFTLRQALSG